MKVPTALVLLTFATGMADAASFIGLGHIFTANMTGNIVFLGFALGGEREVPVLRSLLALAAFLAGAMVGGRVGAAAEGARQRRLPIVFVVEAALFAMAAAVALWAGDPHRDRWMIVFTAMALGMRNAVVRALAVPDVTTTVLTMTVTGLGSEWSIAEGFSARVSRRVSAVMLMLVGSAAGVILLRYGIAAPLLACSVLAMGAACASILEHEIPAAATHELALDSSAVSKSSNKGIPS